MQLKKIWNSFTKIQKRAGQIVSGAIRGTSSIEIHTELSWESLQSRRENKMIILYSDIILHDRTPSYLKPIIPQQLKKLVKADTTYETTQI